MSETPSTEPAHKAPNLKLVTALAVLAALAIALVLVFAIKPLSSSDSGAAKTTGDDPYALNFDGESFSGKRASDKVKTAPVAQRDDAEAKYASACVSCVKKQKLAELPAASATTDVAAGARSNDEVEKLTKEQKNEFASGSRTELDADGMAKAPAGAPEAVQQVIAAGNKIAKYPYIWGGGHGSFQARGYDCSGSVSYALKGANLVDRTMVSGEYMSYGEPGPGKWITIYSHAGHMFMVVGGMRYDTSFRDGPLGSRWQKAKRSYAGFTVTHPKGL
jgi:cell wall-associated NlpC family hydrolase